MRVISKARLVAFWGSRKGDSETAERDLSAWLKLTKVARWANWGELKRTFGSADRVGNCVVFDVGNNRFRLIGRVNYAAGIVYVLKVVDHAEYDRQRWIGRCGCHEPPPGRPAAKKAPPKGKPHAPARPPGRRT
jgi:mRNA interferase HigB